MKRKSTVKSNNNKNIVYVLTINKIVTSVFSSRVKAVNNIKKLTLGTLKKTGDNAYKLYPFYDYRVSFSTVDFYIHEKVLS